MSVIFKSWRNFWKSENYPMGIGDANFLVGKPCAVGERRRTTQWGLATYDFFPNLSYFVSYCRRTTQWGLATAGGGIRPRRQGILSENYPMGIGDAILTSLAVSGYFFVGELPNGDWRPTQLSASHSSVKALRRRTTQWGLATFL